jgi:uroporphyrinogen decarboxylase
MDILALRKEYGKQFAIIGGLRKGALAESREAVMSEIDRKVPAMLKQGGYIPMLDHSVPTNVSLEMFKFFLTYMRK